MNTKLFIRATLLGTAITLLATGHVPARDDAPGYAEDSWGNIIRTGSGECLRTDAWKPERATIVGCDGVVLEAEVEILKASGSGVLTEIVMPSTALFAFDSDKLTAEGRESIEVYRETLMPELAEAYAGIIIGHTDGTGDAKYNQGLSLLRAEAVRDYLVQTGAPAEKLRVIGRGEDEPIASNEAADGQMKNRRVEIIVVAEMRGLDAMRFPSVALFPRRSGELTEQGKQLIEKHREEAREQFKRASYVEIIGHTDDVGDDHYNQELSEQRAQSVFNHLMETGLDVNKVAVIGMGEKMPIASNQTEEGRAENRRVEVLLLGRQRY